MSNCPFKKDITVKEWEEIQARIAELEAIVDCPTVEEIERQSKIPASLAPEPDWRKLVARLAELEKGKPEPKQWEPKIKLTLTSPPTLPNAEFIKIGDKAFQYIRQLQWLYEHYPEQNGEWNKINRWSVCQYNSGTWTPVDNMRFKSPTLIYMSLKAALHLTADMNSGKVRF